MRQRVSAGFRGIERSQQIELRLQDRRAPLHRRAKYGLIFEKFPPHAGLLRTLAGEHEDQRRICPGRAAGEDALRVVRFQSLGSFRGAFGDDDSAVLERAAARLERVCDIRQGELRILPKMPGEICGGAVQRGGRLRGKDQELPAPSRRRGFGQWSLLQNGVRVRAADAKRTHSSAPRLPAAWPRRALGIHDKRAAREVDLRIRRVEVEAGRNRLRDPVPARF